MTAREQAIEAGMDALSEGRIIFDSAGELVAAVVSAAEPIIRADVEAELTFRTADMLIADRRSSRERLRAQVEALESFDTYRDGYRGVVTVVYLDDVLALLRGEPTEYERAQEGWGNDLIIE